MRRNLSGMHVLDIIVAALLVIGGLNWGLIGFFEFNLVAAIFGEGTAMSRVIYALVGLSALYEIYEYTVGFRSMQHRWCEVDTSASPIRH